MNISSLQFIILSIIVSNVVCYPNYMSEDVWKDDIDMCEDSDELDYDLIHDLAMQKLRQVEEIMKRDGVIENISESGSEVIRKRRDGYDHLRHAEEIMKRDGVIENISESGSEVTRKRRDGYDHHDDNIVVRCKHSYTGGNREFLKK